MTSRLRWPDNRSSDARAVLEKLAMSTGSRGGPREQWVDHE